MLIELDDAEPEGAERMKRRTVRRKRRRAKAKLQSKGKTAVRPHKEKTGRTGQIWEKRSHGKGSRFSNQHPNPPFNGWGTR